MSKVLPIEFYALPCTILTVGKDGELIEETGWEFKSPTMSKAIIVNNPDFDAAMEVRDKWLMEKGLISRESYLTIDKIDELLEQLRKI